MKEENDFHILDRDKINFVFTETQEVLKKTLENSDILENKSFIIMGILFAVITGLTKFFVDHFNFKISLENQDWVLLLPILMWIIAYIVSFLFLISSINPTEYQSLGNNPEKLLSKNILRYDIIRIMFGEILTFKPRIEGNEAKNQKKARCIRISLRIIFLAPLASLFLMLILKIDLSSMPTFFFLI